MKKLLGFIAASMLFTGVFGQASFDEKFTTQGNIGLTVTNLGLVGNAFSGSFDLLGYPSCEYPVGSGTEHLFDAGIWIGAQINGNVTAVSTAAVDASRGYTTGLSGFEFAAPVGSSLDERSSLISSPVYDPRAVSHQDFIADFADTAIFVPGTTIPIANHDNPLGIAVHMESYNWNFSFANFFVILNYRIKNVGNNTLDSVFVGYWADPIVRNVNISPPGTGGFFSFGSNGYLDSLYMAYEFDGGSPDTLFTRSFFATKFLGSEDKNGFQHPDLNPFMEGHFNTWQFSNTSNPLYFFPGDDNAKYAKMSLGLNQFAPPLKDWETEIIPEIRVPSNRTQLISVGPYATLEPGDSLDVAFAIICARRVEDGTPIGADSDDSKSLLIQNAGWAQTAYNGEDANFNGFLDPGEDKDGDGEIDRFILPSPPNVPDVRVEAGDGTIDVYWSNNSEFSVDPISNTLDFEGYRLYKTQLGFDIEDIVDVLRSLNVAAEYDLPDNTLFFDTGLDEVRLPSPVTFEGDTTVYYYRYTFENIQNGWQHAVAVTAFDRGDEVNNLESLESSPQPTLFRVFPGKPANENMEEFEPFAYPNPYYAGANWEGASTLEEDRKLIFANLPARCMVRIYTVAGDLVDEFMHDPSYNGEDIRWYSTYSDTETTTFSGGEHAWDLLSRDNQIIARGLYLFSVEDLATGKVYEGKFAVIK